MAGAGETIIDLGASMRNLAKREEYERAVARGENPPAPVFEPVSRRGPPVKPPTPKMLAAQKAHFAKTTRKRIYATGMGLSYKTYKTWREDLDRLVVLQSERAVGIEPADPTEERTIVERFNTKRKPFVDRAAELYQAYLDGKKVDIKRGTIDGVGAWPSQ